MNDYCCICMEKLFIPVEIICFACHKNNQLNCSSLCRLCLFCVHSFLQLNIDGNLRDCYKKCIYCSEMAYLLDLIASNAYRKDYSLMILDKTSDYNCPFCLYYKGSQMMISRHLEKDCIKFPVQCECFRVFPREDFDFHLHSCSHHILCLICNLYIPKIDIKNHMKHDHDHILCKMCNQFIFIENLTLHIENYCPDRFIICSYCLQLTIFKNYKNHLSIHMEDLNNDINKLNADYKRLLANYRQLQCLLNDHNRIPLRLSH